MWGYNMMNGYGGGSSMLAFGWIFYVLLLALMVLAIAALWKYVNKKK